MVSSVAVPGDDVDNAGFDAAMSVLSFVATISFSAIVGAALYWLIVLEIVFDMTKGHVDALIVGVAVMVIIGDVRMPCHVEGADSTTFAASSTIVFNVEVPGAAVDNVGFDAVMSVLSFVATASFSLIVDATLYCVIVSEIVLAMINGLVNTLIVGVVASNGAVVLVVSGVANVLDSVSMRLAFHDTGNYQHGNTDGKRSFINGGLCRPCPLFNLRERAHLLGGDLDVLLDLCGDARSDHFLGMRMRYSLYIELALNLLLKRNGWSLLGRSRLRGNSPRQLSRSDVVLRVRHCLSQRYEHRSRHRLYSFNFFQDFLTKQYPRRDPFPENQFSI